MKKLFTFLLALIAGAGTLFAADSGKCGDNLTWTLTDGVLTISGTGAMDDFTSSTMPWSSHLAAIKSVVIENGATSIGKYAFYNCSKLSAVTIPSSVTSIGNYAFYICKSLSSVTIPNSVTSIGQRAFQNCFGLTSVTLPDAITSIERLTFSGDTVLATITIPAKVETIKMEAFSGCKGLTSITSLATTPPTCQDDCFKDVDKSIPVNVPAGTETAYTAKAGWNEFTNIQSGFKKFDAYKSLTIGGKERKYWLYVPENLPANSPLVITCHEVTGSGYGQRMNSGWSRAFAIAENIVIAYPDGIASGNHSIGPYTNGWDMSGMTDVNFMLAIVDSVKKEYNIDATRVYMSGFNMGGEFVYYVANKAADKFAAFVPISGCQMTPDVTASRPVPIFHVQGTADYVYRYEYAQSCIQAWVAAQHCDPAVTTEESGFTCYRYKNGDGNTEIVFCVKNGGGIEHYPGANDIIWNFCKQYTTPGKVPTGVEGVQRTEYGVQKVLRNGQIVIERDGKTYTVTGQRVE